MIANYNRKNVKLEAAMQQHDEVVKFWEELIEENEDAFELGRDKIFSAMKIAFQCVDISRKWGYLAMEEFVDGGCGVGRDEIPLWEYLKPSVWIVVEVSFGESPERIRMMLETLLTDYHYTGYQAVQGFVYLAGALLMLEKERADRALSFFRFLVPDKHQESFDAYFRPVLEQWEADSGNPE